MEGGGALATDELLKLGNIGDASQLTDLIPISTAALLGIELLLGFNKSVGTGGVSLNGFFDAFGLEATLLTGTWMILLFQMTRWLYSSFYSSTGRPWSPVMFVVALIGVQVVHDLVMYYGSLQNTPTKKNEIIDSLKAYAQENGRRAMLNHSLLLLVVAVLAMVYSEKSVFANVLTVVVALYILPYLLTQAGPKAPPPPPPKAAPKVNVQPQWGMPMGY